jgi:hypothetical protein
VGEVSNKNQAVIAVATWCLAKTSIGGGYEDPNRRWNGPQPAKSGQMTRISPVCSRRFDRNLVNHINFGSIRPAMGQA